MSRIPAEVLHVAVRLRAALSAVMRPLRVRSGDDKTTGSARLAALSHLYRLGEMTPSQLARHEGVRLQTLTRLLAEMEAADLIERTAHPEDGRQSVLSLTAAGASLLTAEARRREAALAEVLQKRLTADERAQLLAACVLLDRVADGLSNAAVSSPADAAR